MVADPSDSAPSPCISYSWHCRHRPMEVRNFEFPVETAGRNISFFFSRCFHFLLQTATLCPTVPHTHTYTQQEKIMLGLRLRSPGSVCGCSWLLWRQTWNVSMWLWGLGAQAGYHTQAEKRHSAVGKHTHTHSKISHRHFTKKPNEQPTEQTALLAASISATTMPLKESRHRLDRIGHRDTGSRWRCKGVQA